MECCDSLYSNLTAPLKVPRNRTMQNIMNDKYMFDFMTRYDRTPPKSMVCQSSNSSC